MAKRSNDSEKAPNKTEMVRAAIHELGWDAKPDAIVREILSRFGVEMEKTMVSSYKSILKKKEGPASESAAMAKPTSGQATAVSSSSTVEAPLDDTYFSGEDIRMMRELANRLGMKKFKILVDVFTS